jgi:hypothetical protein
MRIAVAIATTGRPDTVDLTAPLWTKQTKSYDRLIFSVASDGDLGPGARSLPGVEVLVGPKGSSAQRNTVLNHVGADCDLVAFADDDYLPSRRFLEIAANLFAADPGLAVLTGHVVADGINTAGIQFQEAVSIVERWDQRPAEAAFSAAQISHAYGCNMIVRPAAKPDLRFDEKLPLYGWLEDLDFSRRMGAFGAVCRTQNIIGVHMGVKSGRTSGVRLGYSQVANPMYFVGKGTMQPSEATLQIGRHVMANMVKSFKPEPWVDRAGRLRGNFLALTDALFGRQHPERIKEL